MNSAPDIVKFPDETHVEEGEAVLFKVEVTGNPQPKLTWYHDGEEVVADYSKELSEDGTLSIPSAEDKHTGVYRLVAQNSAGKKEMEVKLFVKMDGGEQPSATTVHHEAILVAMFGNHVKQYHERNNQAFRDEYDVRVYKLCKHSDVFL